MKKAFALLFALLVVFLLLASGCIKPKGSSGSETPGQATPGANTPTATPQKPNLCGNGKIDADENCSSCAKDVKCGTTQECIRGKCIEKEQAIQEKINDCKKLENEIQRDVCIKDVAEKNKKPEFCSLLNIFKKEDCLTNVAVSMKSINPCNEIVDSNAMDLCFKKVADANVNYRLCDNIKDPEYRDGCISTIALKQSDVNACKKINDMLVRDTCITDVALKNKDINLCAFVSTSIKIEFLRDKCYLTLMKDKGGDMAYCFRLLDKTRQGSCIDYAKKTTMPDEKCREFEKQFFQSCFYKQALLNGNYRNCLAFADFNRVPSQQCLTKVADTNFARSEICPYLLDYNKRNYCYSRAAIVRHDAEACALISVKEEEKKCIIKVALDLNDSSVCMAFANDLSQRDDCYMQVAPQLLDMNTCNKCFFMPNYSKCQASIAAKIKQPTLCSIIIKGPFPERQDAVNECYFDYVSITKDTNRCININNIPRRTECEAFKR